MAKQEQVRLSFDFPTRQDAVEWFQGLKSLEAIAPDAAAYELDVLDMKKESGITPSNTYIVRREGDRPDELRLKSVAITEQEIVA